VPPMSATSTKSTTWCELGIRFIKVRSCKQHGYLHRVELHLCVLPGLETKVPTQPHTSAPNPTELREVAVSYLLDYLF